MLHVPTLGLFYFDMENLMTQKILQLYSAIVDVIPLFLGGSINMPIDDNDLEISFFSAHKQFPFENGTEHAVSIHHIPSGVTAQSSGTSSSL